MRTILSTLALVAACGLAHANVKPAAIIGSNMVLQQSGFAPIWGWADPGEEISVTASWAAVPLKTVADASGRWMVRLKTPAASEVKAPGSVTIKGKNTITCENVALGEVWLASGQSNMEWPVSASLNAAKEIADANHPMIRYFSVDNQVSPGAREDCKPQFDGWRVMSPKTAGDCTAVGYFFAREVSQKLGVPVGIIAADWGGTPVESWASGHALKGCGEYTEFLGLLDSLGTDPAQRDAKLAQVADGWWKDVDSHAKGIEAGWNTAAPADAAWKDITVPSVWGGELASFDGFVYYRRTIDIPKEIAGKAGTLELGAIDDRDDTYINGTLVGSVHVAGYAGAPRKYEVPAGVTKAGANVVAIRMRDDQGPGGITAQPENVLLRVGDKSVSVAGSWKYHVGPSASELALPPLADGVNAWSPTCLYNAMIHPLRHYAIRGALWYQGESNRGRPEQYFKVFPAMIQGWREDWGLGDFPFYLVQLAPYNYGNDPGLTSEIRDVQLATLDLVPNTGMACTMDIGDVGNIHPANKQEVGRRLALWALAKTYGDNALVYSGPMYKSIKVDGDSIVVRFDMVGSKGLEARKGEALNFQIAGEDRVFHRAKATIEGSTVRVKRAGLAKPVAVRYAWEGACETNLFNAEGLPVVPFRSDEWERPKDGWPNPKD